MLVDFFNGGLDESISFDLFWDSFEDIVDLLVIFAGWIVISVDGFLEFERFLIGSVRSVRRRNILFLVMRSHFTQTLPFASHLVLSVRFVTPRTIEYIFVFGQRSLIGCHYVVMIHIKIFLQVPSFFRNHIAWTSHLHFSHGCFIWIFKNYLIINHSPNNITPSKESYDPHPLSSTSPHILHRGFMALWNTEDSIRCLKGSPFILFALRWKAIRLSMQLCKRMRRREQRKPSGSMDSSRSVLAWIFTYFSLRLRRTIPYSFDRR